MRAADRSDNVKGMQSCDGEYTDNTTAEEDAHRGAGGSGAAQSPKVVSTSHDESQRHGTFGVVATCICDHPSIGRFLRFCITFFSIVAWVCSSTHPERHWPACFDRTCGYPGEGPLTTMDSPDAKGMCLTPTQEIMMCDMIRRKTKETRGPYMLCRACWNTLTRTHNGRKCRKCHAWACNAACASDVADLHRCRRLGVASHESQSQSCSQGLGSSAAVGTPRLTQGMELATDVQMANVQMAVVQPPSGLPGCAPGGAYRVSRHGSCAHGC